MAKIFIAYRRADSGHISGRIYDRLRHTYGKRSVFKDVDSIPKGMDFREEIRRAVSQSDVLLVLIGDRWIEKDEAGIRRIDLPEDYLRTEIEVALKENKLIIPLLVGSKEMPKAHELPESIRPLSFRDGMPIRPDPDFHHDVDRLTEEIARVCGKRVVPAGSARRVLLWAGAAILIAIATTVVATSPGLRSSLGLSTGAPKESHFYPASPDSLRGVDGKGGAAIVVPLSAQADPQRVTPQAVVLLDSQNTRVPIDVAVVGFDLKVTPTTDLAPASRYRIVLDPGLRSMSREPLVAAMGSQTGGASIPFKTNAPPPPPRPAREIPLTGTIDIMSSTDRAMIETELDGRDLGRTPRAGVSVEADKPHRLVLWGMHSAGGRRVKLVDRSIQVTGGERKTFEPPVPPFGSIVVASKPPGRVFIDGVDTKESTPLAGYLLLSGAHKLRIEPIGEEADAYADVVHDFELPDWGWDSKLGSFSLPPASSHRTSKKD